MRPTPRTPMTFDTRPVRLGFNEFYDGYTLAPALFSHKLLSLDGQQVAIEGYMAPPLKAELGWFVLNADPTCLLSLLQHRRRLAR